MKLKLLNSSLVLACALLLIGSSTVSAQAKNIQQLSNQVTTMQQGLGKVEKDMKKLSRLLDNRAMLELFQRMDELADEVSNLRGMLEQQTHDLARLKKRQRELYLDTDRRLRELEITSNRAPLSVAPAPSEVPVLAAPPGRQVTSKPVVVPTVDSTPAVAPATAPGHTRPATVSTSSKSPATVSEERAAYQKAFDMLKEGRYKMANTSFKGFVKQYPNSSYAGNSQYWLGESNYVTRNFEQAIKEFQAVLNKYPGSNKVPDAMLKLGYTYYELHDFAEAKSILNKLRKRYTKSTAARLAAKRLERMNKEGH